VENDNAQPHAETDEQEAKVRVDFVAGEKAL
jgi:hypothetical protein